MLGDLARAAASSIQGAMVVFIIILACALIVGGPKGGRWVINTAFAPIKMVLGKRIKALIYICVFVIVSYYCGSRVSAVLGIGR
jgi:hypothetical protein